MHQQSGGDIEFWFDFGSNYSYLSAMRIEPLARAAGVTVTWMPFLLGPIFQSFGWSSSPFVLQKEKGAYVWRDMQRECRKYGLPWRRPSTFPRGSVLAARVGVLGAGQAWLVPFCQAVMERNFVADQEIDGEADVAEVLTALGLDAQATIARAQSDVNKASLRARGEQARERGIFGAPSLFVGDELFWGNDRLEDAIALAHSCERADAAGLRT